LNIISRAQWGAKPPRTTPIPLKLPVSELFVHHTVTAITANRIADVRVVQDIAFSRQFNDISYNWLVDIDGHVYEGRGFNVGAHVEGRNSKSMGVALIGDYSHRVVADAQVDSIRQLVAWLISRDALTPGLYPTGGHRDAPDAHTACPGEFAMRRIVEMRAPWIGLPDSPAREELVVVNAPPVAVLMHPAWPEGSYLIVCADGGTFPFGGAPQHGSLGNVTLNAPIVDAVVTPSGNGLKMLGRDGGDFNFGDSQPNGRVEYTGP
jgi:hypothetical protein